MSEKFINSTWLFFAQEDSDSVQSGSGSVGIIFKFLCGYFERYFSPQ
jgi:hypothetical protein